MHAKIKILVMVLGVGFIAFGFTQGAWASNFYVPLGAAGQVAEIDSDSYRIKRLIGGFANAHGLGISTDGKFLYVGSLVESTEANPSRPVGVSEADHAAHHGGGSGSAASKNNSVSFITRVEIQKGTVAKRINVERFTHHVAVTPDGAHVIGVQSGAQRIVVIDARTDKVVRYVQVGKAPNYAAVSSDGRTVYVSNSGSGTISVLDSRSWTEKSRIPVGKGPEHILLSRDGRRLYVVNTQSDELSVVDTGTLRELKRVPTGKQPHGIGEDFASGRLAVANTGADSVSVYDLNGGALSTFSLAPQPYHVEIGPNGSDILISSRAIGKIWVISGANLNVAKIIELPGIGHQIAYVR